MCKGESLSRGHDDSGPAEGALTFTVNDRLYAVPPTFLHPGGREALEVYEGQDVSNLFDGSDAAVHSHSKAAGQLLQSFLLPSQPAADVPPMQERQEQQQRQQTACAASSNMRLDPSQPVVFQVGHLGAAYSNWVHVPQPGAPRYFRSDLLEALTRTKWWVVPLLWVPLVAAVVSSTLRNPALPVPQAIVLVIAGVLLWQLLEYSIHRWAFHAEPVSWWGITLHFALHGCHHKFPMDALRLVFPPAPGLLAASGIYGALRLLFAKDTAVGLFGGVIAGYLHYDCLHYAMHHSRMLGYLRRLQSAHMDHHYRHTKHGFGISSNLFDVLLGTLPPSGTEPAALKLGVALAGEQSVFSPDAKMAFSLRKAITPLWKQVLISQPGPLGNAGQLLPCLLQLLHKVKAVLVFRPWPDSDSARRAAQHNSGSEAGCCSSMGSAQAVDVVATRDHVSYCFDVLFSHYNGGKLEPPRFADTYCPLFVTWNKASPIGGEVRLRGCIGTLEPRQLRVALKDYALTSALRDRRFSPVQLKEVPLLHCTVSLLHAFEQAAHWRDWQVGMHGLVIEFVDPSMRVTRSATFLPEVAAHERWSQQQTIDNLIHKAGYKGACSEELRRSLGITRYRSTAHSLSYEEYYSGSQEPAESLGDTSPTSQMVMVPA